MQYFYLIQATVYIVIGHFPVYWLPLPNRIMRLFGERDKLFNYATDDANEQSAGLRWESGNPCIKSDVRDMRYTFNYLILIKIRILPAACMINNCILSGCGYFRRVRERNCSWGCSRN